MQIRSYSPAQTGRSHGSYELSVDQLYGGRVSQVVPRAVIEPLTKQLDRRLCAVLLTSWHVQVIHKYHL